MTADVFCSSVDDEFEAGPPINPRAITLLALVRHQAYILNTGGERLAVRRAYFYLRGADDEMMAVTLSLWQPELQWTRMTLQGLLCARDVSLDGIAHLLEFPRQVVELFATLFFPVRSRGISFLASLAFPQTRLGAIKEAEAEVDNLELTLMRLGRDYGWQEVARAVGLKGIEHDNSIDNQVEELERLTFGNALMIGRAGGLNRRSQGLQYARTLIATRRNMQTQRDDDSRRGLGGMSMSMAINESFMAIVKPDLDRRMALLQGMEVEQVNKAKDAASAAEAKPA